MSRRHLEEDTTPLTAEEIEQPGQGATEQGECIMPVPDNVAPPAFKHHGHDPDRRFAYRDADGKILGYVLRWNAHNGTSNKEIRPFTYWRNGASKGAWRCASWPTPRPLFGLDQLAAHPDALVLLVEGENKVEAVKRGPLAGDLMWTAEKIVGISWPGGARAIGKADFSPLAGRDVIVLPDHDQPGEQAADALVDVLREIGITRLRRWRAPPEAAESWDIANEPPAGWTSEALVKSILEAPDIATEPPHIVVTLEQFLAEYVPPDYLIDGILQSHYFYSLTGMTGAGKTAVMLLIAVKVSTRSGGQKLGPHDIERGRVVYITKENPTDVRMRLIGMAIKLSINPAHLDFFVIQEIEDISKDLPRI